MNDPLGTEPLPEARPAGRPPRLHSSSAANAGMWVGVSVLATQVVLLLNSIVMARFLTPAEFGVVELCITIALFVNILGENGLSAEIVQQRELSPVYLSTAYWGNVGAGAILSLLGLLGVVMLRDVASDPETLLLFALTFLNFAVNGVSIVQRVLLVRELDFARLAVIEIAGVTIFVVFSTVLALLGAGATAYIAGWLLRTAIITLLIFFSVDWRPAFVFRWQDFRSMSSFGANVFAGRVLVYTNSNLDRFFIWRALGDEVLGFYSLSRRIPTGVASLLYSIVLRVTYPLMARHQQDRQRLNQMYLRTVSLLAMLVLPVMALLVVLAQPLILVVFGPQWEAVIFATRIMALTPLFVILVLPCDSAFQAVGRPDLVWKNYALRLALYVVFLAVGVQYGLDILAVVTLAYMIAAAFLTQLFVQHVFGISWGNLAAAIWGPLRNSTICGMAALAALLVGQLSPLPEAALLLLAGSAGAVAYLMAFRVLNADELAQMCDLVGGAVNRPVVSSRLRALLQL